MGIGFVVTILLLAVLLGLFSRQALGTAEVKSEQEVKTATDDTAETSAPRRFSAS